MAKYIIKRLLLLVPVLLVVSFLVFFLMSHAGDPVSMMTGDYATEAEIEALRESMGLNDPLVIRYFNYMKDLFQGNLGKTLYGHDVLKELTSRLPYTVALSVVSIIITIIISLPFGIIAAVKQNSWLDTGLSATAMAGISIPDFWVGLMFAFVFAIRLRCLPASGAESWTGIIMPAVCLGINNCAVLTRMTRSSMVDVIRADYLRTARAKGVGERDVILKHALKNALIPILTIVGSQVVILLGGSVVIESLFAWPGLGSYVVTCIRSCEYIAATSIILFQTTLTAVLLLCVDVLYAYVDPRIKARYTK